MKIERTNSRGHIFWFTCKCGHTDFLVSIVASRVVCKSCGFIIDRLDRALEGYAVPPLQRGVRYDVPAEKVIAP